MERPLKIGRLLPMCDRTFYMGIDLSAASSTTHAAVESRRRAESTESLPETSRMESEKTTGLTTEPTTTFAFTSAVAPRVVRRFLARPSIALIEVWNDSMVSRTDWWLSRYTLSLKPMISMKATKRLHVFTHSMDFFAMCPNLSNNCGYVGTIALPMQEDQDRSNGLVLEYTDTTRTSTKPLRDVLSNVRLLSEN